MKGLVMDYDYGRAIKIARTIRNKTQIELANKVGVTSGFISMLEKGSRNLKLETLGKIAKALSVTTIDICTLAHTSDSVEGLSKPLADDICRIFIDLMFNKQE